MPEKINSLVEKKKNKIKLPEIQLSLKIKALIPTISIILLFGLMATYFVYKQTITNLISLEKESVSVVTQKQAREVAKFFKMGEYIVEAIANHPDIVEYTQDKSIQNSDILKLLQNYNLGDSFLAIYIMDNSGNTLVSTDPSFVGNNYSYRKYFQDALGFGSSIDVAVGSTSGELGYYFSNAVKIDGATDMVVVAKMKPEKINCSIINQSSGRGNIDSFLVDELGVVICGTEQDKIFKSLGKMNHTQKENLENWRRYPYDINPLEYDVLQVSMGSFDDVEVFDIQEELDKERELLFIKKLEDAPFFVFTEVKLKGIQSAATRSALNIGVVVIIAAITALFLISIVVTKLLDPIDELTNDAVEVAGGNYEKRFKVIKTHDELEKLGEAFEVMRKKFVEIRGSLEERVELQTKDIEEKQAALLNVLEDVEDEKKEAQQAVQDLKKFKMATDSVSEQIIITDPDAKIIYANPATEKITGYKIEDIIGKKAGSNELWGGNMEKDFYAEMWDTIKNKKKPFKGELKNTRKNGQDYVVSSIIAPVLDENDEVIFFVATEEDITRRKEVDRMKTEFISLASHQLRTPLSAMKWFLEMLLDGDVGKLNEEQEEYIININDSNERMIKLVSSLLNVSRIESGRIIVDPQPTKLRDLVDQVITELQPKLDEKDISFVFSASDNIPEINIDPKLIRNVYQNLLTNAIKYTPGGGEVTVFISKEDDRIISQVTDNGYGIPEDSKDKIFDKFFRASNIVQKDPDGNGLGLYLVKAVVETSGGEVWFESEEGEGTTFWFSLPMGGSMAKEGVVSIDS